MNLQGPLWRFTGVRPLAWAFFAFLYIPIVVLVALSFNAGQSATLWQGFSLKWYGVVANDPEILRAAKNSLIVATLATLIATCLATLAALGMHGRRFRGQALVHRDMAGQQAPHGVLGAVGQRDGFEQRHHAAALGPQGLALQHMGHQAGLHAGVGGDAVGVQLGVAAGQPHGVAFGQGSVIQRGEEHHARAQLFQRLQVGRVGKAERSIAPHGHGAARQQGRHRH